MKKAFQELFLSWYFCRMFFIREEKYYIKTCVEVSNRPFFLQNKMLSHTDLLLTAKLKETTEKSSHVSPC